MTMEECKSDTPLYYVSFYFLYYYGNTVTVSRLRLSLSVVWKHFILHPSYSSIYLEWCLRCYVLYDNDDKDFAFLHDITFYILVLLCVYYTFLDIYL